MVKKSDLNRNPTAAKGGAQTPKNNKPVKKRIIMKIPSKG